MAVIICVQDRMHAECTIEFAPRGFHVLCEKPLAAVSGRRANRYYYHIGHSYARGHWQAEGTSVPILLTQSSRDIDIFSKGLWPLVPSKVSSFAGLGHFRKERKLEGAEGVKRCLECPDNIESRCKYSAKKSASFVPPQVYSYLRD